MAEFKNKFLTPAYEFDFSDVKKPELENPLFFHSKNSSPSSVGLNHIRKMDNK
jgi:hypothetical protein